MGIPPYPRQSGAALIANRNRPAHSHAGTLRSAPSLDALFVEATSLLSGFPWDGVRMDVESAMDYLASREDFMRHLEFRAELLLCRPSFGPEDTPFEDILVDTMTALQARLESDIL